MSKTNNEGLYKVRGAYFKINDTVDDNKYLSESKDAADLLNCLMPHGTYILNSDEWEKFKIALDSLKVTITDLN